MPVKIGFQVISCSGEDEKYRVSELNYHGPTVRGWRSPLNCKFPQEIMLKLKFPAILHQIQILVHQYLIPQKIEIHTSSRLDFEMPCESSQDMFEYLGFITFSDNKATEFRSRELKSILIPSKKAKYVKLRIHSNHVNNKNIYNQVGLIGINLIGNEIDFKTQETELNSNLWHGSNAICPKPIAFNSNYISPYDDLAFEMYVDEETAKIIKYIECKKQQAIFEDHFEYATNLKIMLKKLRAAGEIIGLYEQEKKQAIQSEDYDRAKFKKFQIEKFRRKVYSALQIDQVLDTYQNEERTSRSFPSKPEDRNDCCISKSDSGDVVERNSNFEEKFVEGGRSPSKSVHLTHSKSQTSFPPHRDLTSPAFVRNQAFTTSMSNPQLNHYMQSNCDGETKSTVDTKLEHIGTTSPSNSNSSDPEEEDATSGPVEFLKGGSDLVARPNEESDEKGKKGDGNKSQLCSNGPTAPARSQPERNRSKFVTTNASKSSFEAYEDRMLPALKSYHGNEVVRECQLVFDQQAKTTLNEKERKQAILPISVFGIEMIEKFFSKNFSEKEEGLKLLQRELKKIVDSDGESNEGAIQSSYDKVARAVIFLLHRTLRDKVYSVYSAAAETIRFFFTEFVPRRVSPSEVTRSVEKLLPELLAKSGDVTPRIHNMAAHTLLSMAECEEVRRLHIIPSHLSRPLMSSVHPRLALSRLEMVEQLILNLGISKDKRSGLTCRTLAEFGSSGLHHPAEAVRKVSERILIHVYKINPIIVRKQLPPDDNVTRRNLLYRHLFQEFDLMDAERKLTEKNNDEQEFKRKISAQNCISKRNPEHSPNKIVFSNNHIQENAGKKSPEFILQSKILKNVVPLNLKERNEIKNSPQKKQIKSPSRFHEKNLIGVSAEMTTHKSSKVDFYLENMNLKKKNLNLTGNLKKERKTEKNSETFLNAATGKDGPEYDVSAVKFPSLADSIDTNKARMLLEERKNLERKEGKYAFARNQTQSISTNNEAKSNPNQSAPKKTVKRDFNCSSGLPLPTSGSTRKYHRNIPKKLDKNKKTDYPVLLSNGSAENNINNSKLSWKPIKSKYQLAEEKSLEVANFKKEMFESMQKNTEMFRYCLKKNVEKINCKNQKATEKSNPFSESMLASIRENEYPSNSVLNGMAKERRALKTCIFCLSAKKWADDENLNNHYLNDCPMLTTCEYCMEVIEISGFTNHLLGECNQRHLFQKCCKCQQAVLEDLMDNHECSAFSKLYKTRCPFCHKDIGSGDSCWRKHFMGNNICTNHPRQMQ